VLRAVDLEVRRGEIVAIAGPNGAGKTTLARMLAGLLEPASGRIERTGRAGYLGQDPGRHLVCDRAVDEVALSVGGDRERALAALAAAGLAWSADRHPRDLSSGERERLALAAVAVAAPDLLVLDEPTRGVDPERKLALARSLASLARRGHAVAVVTHDPDFPAHRRVVLEPAFEGASA
jgi:energy-coupling factor transport system ATP-binding protein